METIDRLQRHLSLIRTCAGWTASDLGEKLKVSRQTISAFEKEGNQLSMMQYLAIRQVIEHEIADSKDSGGMLAMVFDALVDHPESYDNAERNEILSKAKLMAPSVMKNPDERKTVSTALKAILIASGVVVSAALLAFLKKDD